MPLGPPVRSNIGAPRGGLSVVSRFGMPLRSGLEHMEKGSIGSRDLTPDIVKETVAPGMVTGRFTAPPNTWKACRVDRPTILWTTYVVDRAQTSANGSLQQPIIFYNYGEIPQTIPGSSVLQASQSTKGGLCFLSSPGLWFLRSIADIDCLMIDAWHPGVAAKYFSDSGVNSTFQTTTNVPVSAATTQLWAGNRSRVAGTVQLISGGPVRVALGQIAAYLTGGLSGLILAGQGAAISFQGDAFGTGALLAILNQQGGAGAAAVVETIEYNNG